MMKKTTLFQFFHWYYPDGGKLWPEVAEKAEYLAQLGMSHVWLPPASKGASGGYSVGYDSYDLFDLGEFDQKGSVPTKYGDRCGLEQAAQSLQSHGLQVLFDVVLNHKLGADEKERVFVRRVEEHDRNDIDDHTFEALTYTRFTFPGRQGKYSEFVWDFRCFNGVDYIEDPDENGIFKIMNDFGDDGWNDDVDKENGNYDYLMGADVEFRNEAVTEELKFWGRWLLDSVPCDGFRLDAVKHIPSWFYSQWLDHLREHSGRELFTVAEYWSPEVGALENYLNETEHKVMLFDSVLHKKFHHASKSGNAYDLSTIFADTLVAIAPENTVTLVANHDTQPLQSLEAPVEPWFKPLAYALILLREQGVPSVFYPDLFGATYTDKGDDEQDHEIIMPIIPELEKLLEARQRFANGAQHDYFDDPQCIAFVRDGTGEAPGCVVVLTNGDVAAKHVQLTEGLAGRRFYDFLGNHEDIVTAGDDATADFPVSAGSVSVWVLEQ